MTTKKRKILFWLFGILFIATAVPILLYSGGYRFSKESFRIVRTGAIFVSSTPSSEVNVYLNDKYIKTTSLLSRTTFLQNLTPGTYKIRLEKNGFRTWEKILLIKPEMVTDAWALLVRDPPDAKVISASGFIGIDTYNNRTLMLTAKSGDSFYYDILTKKYIEPNQNTESETDEEKDEFESIISEVIPKDADGYISDYDEKIIWWKDSEIWIRWIGDSTPYYATEKVSQLFKSSHSIKQVMFYPRRAAILTATSNEIIVIELDGRGGNVATSLYKGKKPLLEIPDERKRTVYVLDDENLIEINIL